MPSKLDLAFSRVALENNLVSPEVAKKVLVAVEERERSNDPTTVPDHMVDGKLISKTVALAILQVVERKESIRFVPRPKPAQQDLVFARLVLANKLVSKEKVEDCLKEIGRRNTYVDLANIMEEKGYLSRKMIEKIFDAWNRRKAELSREREEQQKLQKMVEEQRKSEELIDSAVKKYLRSLLHLQVLSYMEEHKNPVVEPKKIADHLGVSEKDVREIIPYFIRSGVMRQLTEHAHQYSPGEMCGKEIREIMRWLRDEKRRKVLLGKVAGKGA